MLTLKEFLYKYTGQKNVGNTPQNTGECVGLVMVWVANLGLSHFWGHAKDLFDNAPADQFSKFKNSPDIYPVGGDIITWNGRFAGSGGYGHTALVLWSNHEQDSFTVLEQNNPLGESGLQCEITTYKEWTNVIGWLRPKNYKDGSDCSGEFAELEVKITELRGQREKYREQIDDLNAEIRTFERNQEVLVDARNKAEEQLAGCIKSRKEIEDTLKKELADKNKHIESLITKNKEMATSHTNEINDMRSDYENKLTGVREKLAECEAHEEVTLMSFSWSERFKSLFRRSGA